MVITSTFGYRSTAHDVVAGHDLTGRTALLTGASSGIGLEAARALAGAGAHVILPVRDPMRGEAAVTSIRSSHPRASVELAILDLSSLTSIRDLTSRLTNSHGRLDLLVNNAGVMATPFEHTLDGFEMQFGTNHLGHFALFLGLRPLMRAASAPRVIALSSIAHRMSAVDLDDPNFRERPYDKWIAYGQSKTACSLFAVGVGRHGEVANATAFAVHPGGIMTGLQKFLPAEEVRAMGWVDDHGTVNELFKTVEQGAATTVWAAVGDELTGHTGLYLENCQQAEPWQASLPMMGVKDYAIDPTSADLLWTLSNELIDAVP